MMKVRTFIGKFWCKKRKHKDLVEEIKEERKQEFILLSPPESRSKDRRSIYDLSSPIILEENSGKRRKLNPEKKYQPIGPQQPFPITKLTLHPSQRTIYI